MTTGFLKIWFYNSDIQYYYVVLCNCTNFSDNELGYTTELNDQFEYGVIKFNIKAECEDEKKYPTIDKTEAFSILKNEILAHLEVQRNEFLRENDRRMNSIKDLKVEDI